MTGPQAIDAILDALQKHGARLTGSWARGEEHDGSDYDFYIRDSKWKAFVKAAPPGWESPTVGSIGWRVDGVLIEASCIFRRQPKERLPERTVLGRTWQTW